MFVPYDFFILRAPKLPLRFVRELNAQVSTDQVETYLGQLYDRQDTREAIFIASTELFSEVIKWRSGKAEVKDKLLKTLYKYTIRMASRPTPYGLFAGIVPGTITDGENGTELMLSDTNHPAFRLDMQCLSQLSDIIAKDPVLRTRLKYSINSSLYRHDDNYRFFRQQDENGKRVHLLTALKATPPIESILSSAAKGIAYSDLLKKLIALGAQRNQAEHLLDRMINNQLIVSELEPNLTGKDFFNKLLEKTCKIDKENRFYPLLKKIDSDLKKGFSVIDATNRISEIIADISPLIQRRNVIQCDLLLEAQNNRLDKKSLEVITDQLNELQPLNIARQPADLKHFIERFVKRYEDREIPMLDVLDPDTGIGYGQSPTDYRKGDEVMRELRFPGTASQKNEDNCFYRDWLLEKYITSVEERSREIVLRAKDLDQLEQSITPDKSIPPTSYAIGNLLKKETGNTGEGAFRLHLHGLVGSSAITLMSRFGYLSDELLSNLKFISNMEQEAYPDALIAEVVHLPDTRSGNVLQRPYSRAYEIPLLCRTGKDADSIDLSDILVSVKNKRVILRSKRLKKEIIPRLTTAHNYQNGMHIYRFLGDLQYQDNRFRIKWDWDNLRKRPFLPRVSYKDIILSRAIWNIEATAQNIHLLNSGRITDFLTTYKLPTQVVLADSDNELIIDFENPLAKSIFLDRLSKGNVTLYEPLFSHSNSPIIDIDGNHFANEIIIPFKSDQYKNTGPLPDHTSTAIRFFPPGSDWLYVKIFCGPQQADKLLREHIFEIVSRLESKQLLDKWFFLRYNENGHHIRLRLLKKNCCGFSEIAEVVYRVLSPLVTADLISGYQFDTYIREIERYGPEYIDTTERLFHIDSRYVLDILKVRPDVNQRWLLAIYGIAQLLDAANFYLEEKLAFCERMRLAYFLEFNGDKELERQLNRQFRNRRPDMEQVLKGKHVLSLQHPFIEKRALSLKRLFSDLKEKETRRGGKKEDLFHLLSSYAHMYINRLFISEQRLHELVTYHFLCKLYLIDIGKEKANLHLFSTP